MYIPDPGATTPPPMPDPDSLLGFVGSLAWLAGILLVLAVMSSLVAILTARVEGQRYTARAPEPKAVEPAKPPLPDWWRESPELMEISLLKGTVTTGDVQMARADAQLQRSREQLTAAAAQLQRENRRLADNKSQLQAIASQWRARTERNG